MCVQIRFGCCFCYVFPTHIPVCRLFFVAPWCKLCVFLWLRWRQAHISWSQDPMDVASLHFSGSLVAFGPSMEAVCANLPPLPCSTFHKGNAFHDATPLPTHTHTHIHTTSTPSISIFCLCSCNLSNWPPPQSTVFYKILRKYVSKWLTILSRPRRSYQGETHYITISIKLFVIKEKLKQVNFNKATVQNYWLYMYKCDQNLIYWFNLQYKPVDCIRVIVIKI